ncbi:MAG: gliding motility-associated C-terminal domain-containing protein [Crocinitomicaceae bacterium]
MLKKLSILFLSMLFGTTLNFAQDTSHEPGIYNFIPNGGQWPDHVNFRADIQGGKLWLEENGVLYQFTKYPHIHGDHFVDEKANEKHNEEVEQHLVFAEFVGANQVADFEMLHPSTEYYNYFLGNDKSKWATGLRAYNEISYRSLYDKIDLRFYEKEAELKYEFIVAPQGDPSQINIHYHGQDKIKKNKDGNIEIFTTLGKIIEQKPFAYQVKNGKIAEIECEFILTEEGQITFQIGDYDKNLDLIIDPVLIFATYSGSVTDNFGMTATYAYDGKGYSGGTIYGNAYPTPAPAYNTTSNFTGPSSANYGITDVFISKYLADGTNMIWTSFIGGGDNTQGTETVHSLICDTLNNIYLYGATSSTNFPIQNGYQTSHAGGVAGSNYYYNGVYYSTQGTDIYLAKLSSDGLNLLGSTYMGGSANDGVNYRIAGGTYNSVASYDSLTSNYGDQFRGEIMLDSMNNILIASSTRSNDFPTANAFQPSLGGQQDGVVFKVSADFSTLLWSSYYGGTQNDACYSVKIDSSYNILFAGGTSSSNLPGTAGGLHPTYQGGKTDGFVAKLTPDGSTLTQSTYIGTSTYDQAIFVEIDRWNNVYLVGVTNGPMPVINAPYSNPNSGQFIMKLLPDLATIDYSTVFGSGNGIPNISPSAFLVDVCGNVYVSGWGANILQSVPLSGMPTTIDAFQSSPPDGFDFYLFVLERDAQSILYGSYLGDANAHEHVDGGTSRFDKFGIVYQSVCGGCGGSSTFPTTPGAWSNNNLSTNCNNILFKYDFEIVPEADFTISDLEGCAPFTFVLDNESNDTVNSVWTFPPEAVIVQGGINPQIMFNDPGQYNIILSITDTICNLQDTAVKVINVYDPLLLDVMDDTVVCDGSSVTIWANSFGSGTSFLWYDDPGMTNQINTGGMDSTVSVTPVITTTYYVHATNGWPLCDIIDSVTIVTADGAVGLDDNVSMCLGDTTAFMAHNLLPSETMSFSWSPSTGIINTADSIAWVSPSGSMWYYLTATTGSGCVFYDSIYVTVTNIDPNTVYATATNDTIPSGDVSVLEAFPNNPNYTYLWLPPYALDTVWGQTVHANPEQTTEYVVTITGDGCETSAKVQVVVVEFICGDVYIFVPNAFSPNGDNENDVLYVRGTFLEEIDFKIFDRWGEKVFETQDQSLGWDGTFKGELVDPDVYVYHLKAICFDGQETLIKGNITVLR